MPFINIIPDLFNNTTNDISSRQKWRHSYQLKLVLSSVRIYEREHQEQRDMYLIAPSIIALQNAGEFLVIGKIIIIKSFASTFVLCYLRILIALRIFLQCSFSMRYVFKLILCIPCVYHYVIN